MDDNIEIYGDENGIKQIAVILIDNALAHTFENGEITISLKQAQSKKYFSVTNTGEGISDEDKQKIFERFYRADKARSRQNGNYGLGLAIAKAIVDEHKGKIFVESKQGEWARFTVVLN
ncbi:MAG: sensor histidine kinase [Acutalibacteraceae bacterium]